MNLYRILGFDSPDIRVTDPEAESKAARAIDAINAETLKLAELGRRTARAIERRELAVAAAIAAINEFCPSDRAAVIAMLRDRLERPWSV